MRLMKNCNPSRSLNSRVVHGIAFKQISNDGVDRVKSYTTGCEVRGLQIPA